MAVSLQKTPEEYRLGAAACAAKKGKTPEEYRLRGSHSRNVLTPAQQCEAWTRVSDKKNAAAAAKNSTLIWGSHPPGILAMWTLLPIKRA